MKTTVFWNLVWVCLTFGAVLASSQQQEYAGDNYGVGIGVDFQTAEGWFMAPTTTNRDIAGAKKKWKEMAEHFEEGTCFNSSLKAPRFNVPVILQSNDWDSHYVVTLLCKLLLEEVLGYVVLIDDDNPMADSVLPRLADGRAHANMEKWFLYSNKGNDSTGYERYVTEAKTVVDGGYLGTIGQSGLYIPTKAIRLNPDLYLEYWKAFANPNGLALDLFRKDSWDLLTAFKLTRPGVMKTANGTWVCESDVNRSKFGQPANGCVDGMYVPPLCRADVRSCMVLFIMDPDIDPGWISNMVKNLELKFVVAFLGDEFYFEFLELAVREEKNIMMYWWEPDSFASQVCGWTSGIYESCFTRMLFPRPTEDCLVEEATAAVVDNIPGEKKTGVFCDFPALYLRSMYWHGFSKNPHFYEANQLLNSVSFTNIDIDNILTNMHLITIALGGLESTVAHEVENKEVNYMKAAVCSFLHDNRQRWEPWIPKPRPCDTTDYIVSISECKPDVFKRELQFAWQTPHACTAGLSRDQGTTLPKSMLVDCSFVPLGSRKGMTVVLGGCFCFVMVALSMAFLVKNRTEMVLRRLYIIRLFSTLVGTLIMIVFSFINVTEVSDLVCTLRLTLGVSGTLIFFSSFYFTAMRANALQSQRGMLSFQKNTRREIIFLYVYNLAFITLWVVFASPKKDVRFIKLKVGASVEFDTCASDFPLGGLFGSFNMWWVVKTLLVCLRLIYASFKKSEGWKDALNIFGPAWEYGHVGFSIVGSSVITLIGLFGFLVMSDPLWLSLSIAAQCVAVFACITLIGPLYAQLRRQRKPHLNGPNSSPHHQKDEMGGLAESSSRGRKSGIGRLSALFTGNSGIEMKTPFLKTDGGGQVQWKTPQFSLMVAGEKEAIVNAAAQRDATKSDFVTMVLDNYIARCMFIRFQESRYCTESIQFWCQVDEYIFRIPDVEDVLEEAEKGDGVCNLSGDSSPNMSKARPRTSIKPTMGLADTLGFSSSGPGAGSRQGSRRVSDASTGLHQQQSVAAKQSRPYGLSSAVTCPSSTSSHGGAGLQQTQALMLATAAPFLTPQAALACAEDIYHTCIRPGCDAQVNISARMSSEVHERLKACQAMIDEKGNEYTEPLTQKLESIFDDVIREVVMVMKNNDFKSFLNSKYALMTDDLLQWFDSWVKLDPDMKLASLSQMSLNIVNEGESAGGYVEKAKKKKRI